MRTNLQPWIVQIVTAFEGNLIMMNLEKRLFLQNVYDEPFLELLMMNIEICL